MNVVQSAEEFVSKYLLDGLWHTTAPDRFEVILTTGHLEPEPDLPNRIRHKTAAGPDAYPYARSIGGISLFDFTGFDPSRYDADYRLSNWRAFIPGWREWPAAVWIELRRDKLSAFIGGQDLLERWKSDKAFRHTIMPVIEAAHIGAIPVSAFRRVFVATQSMGNGWRIEARPLKASRSAPGRF